MVDRCVVVYEIVGFVSMVAEFHAWNGRFFSIRIVSRCAALFFPRNPHHKCCTSGVVVIIIRYNRIIENVAGISSIIVRTTD